MPIRPVDTATARCPHATGTGTGTGWQSLLAGCLAIVSLPLLAAPTSTSWLCWYDDEEAILCQLWTTDPVAAIAAIASPATDNPLPGTTPALDERLPAAVRTIRERPAETLGQRIRIPLFTVPEDLGFVHELADAVMCGVKADCQVRFLASRATLALLLDELEDAT